MTFVITHYIRTIARLQNHQLAEYGQRSIFLFTIKYTVQSWGVSAPEASGSVFLPPDSSCHFLSPQCCRVPISVLMRYHATFLVINASCKKSTWLESTIIILVMFYLSTTWRCSKHLKINYPSIAETAVIPYIKHWSYCSLALSHRHLK